MFNRLHDVTFQSVTLTITAVITSDLTIVYFYAYPDDKN